MAGASLATNLGHFCPLLLIKDLVTNCHKIGHLFFDLVELDKTYPHYLILLGWYWNTEEGSTNLQARFYSQQELGSDIHLAQLQGRWKAGLQEQGERRRHSLALTARRGAPWLLPFFSNRGWRLGAFFLGSPSCMIWSREHFVKWVQECIPSPCMSAAALWWED